jgi:hypothetical protein
MRISNDLVLFRKALHTLTGIAGELSTPRAVDAALLASALGQYLGDSAGAAVNPAGAGSAAAGAANAALIGLWFHSRAGAAQRKSFSLSVRSDRLHRDDRMKTGFAGNGIHRRTGRETP